MSDHNTLRIRIDDLPPMETLTPEEEAELFGAGPRKAHLNVEMLEARQMMTSGLSASLSAGILKVQTPTAGDMVKVRVEGSNLAVSGMGGHTKSFALDQVQQVQVDARGGTSAIDAVFAGAMPISVQHTGASQASFLLKSDGHLYKDGTQDLGVVKNVVAEAGGEVFVNQSHMQVLTRAFQVEQSGAMTSTISNSQDWLSWLKTSTVYQGQDAKGDANAYLVRDGGLFERVSGNWVKLGNANQVLSASGGATVVRSGTTVYTISPNQRTQVHHNVTALVQATTGGVNVIFRQVGTALQRLHEGAWSTRDTNTTTLVQAGTNLYRLNTSGQILKFDGAWKPVSLPEGATSVTLDAGGNVTIMVLAKKFRTTVASAGADLSKWTEQITWTENDVQQVNGKPMVFANGTLYKLKGETFSTDMTQWTDIGFISHNASILGSGKIFYPSGKAADPSVYIVGASNTSARSATGAAISYANWSGVMKENFVGLTKEKVTIEIDGWLYETALGPNISQNLRDWTLVGGNSTNLPKPPGFGKESTDGSFDLVVLKQGGYAIGASGQSGEKITITAVANATNGEAFLLTDKKVVLKTNRNQVEVVATGVTEFVFGSDRMREWGFKNERDLTIPGEFLAKHPGCDWSKLTGETNALGNNVILLDGVAYELDNEFQANKVAENVFAIGKKNDEIWLQHDSASSNNCTYVSGGSIITRESTEKERLKLFLNPGSISPQLAAQRQSESLAGMVQIGGGFGVFNPLVALRTNMALRPDILDNVSAW